MQNIRIIKKELELLFQNLDIKFLAKGNYWDNYTGVDSDQNGIGDVPYNITGSAGSKDNFPLMSCPLLVSDEAIPGYDLLIIYLIGITMILGVIYTKLKKKIRVK
ncbi:MAG: hypothetical protein ACFFDL_15530 [Promethearchaeota archaeon]